MHHLRRACITALFAGALVHPAAQEAAPAAPPGAPPLQMATTLAAPPADAPPSGRRLDVLESDLAALRQAVRRNEAALAQLRQDIAGVQTRNLASPLAWLLGAVIAAALAVVAWTWRRRPAPAEAFTWHDAISEPAPLVQAEPAPVPPPPLEPEAPSSSTPPDSSPPAASFPASSFTDSGTMRVASAEELQGLEEQVEFFLSIGQPENAVQLLSAHIEANPTTSPLAWLDLLRILHGLGRREEFEARRSAFHRNFNARLPPFDEYSEDAGPGLEAYQAAMSRVVALWPSRKVLEVIRESVFRPPELLDGPAFSLAAYRDLLLLYHVGQLVLAMDKDVDYLGPLSTGDHTGMQPLPLDMPSIAADMGESSLAAELELDPGLGLDIDFTRFGSPKPEEDPVSRSELEALERVLAQEGARSVPASHEVDIELP